MTRQPLLSGFEEVLSSKPSTTTNDIRDFPNLSRRTLSQHAKWFGLAGEYLVDSILLRFGFCTSPMPEMMPADRLLCLPEGPLRLQIKTCCRPRDGYFHFSLTKGYHRAPGGIRPYEPDDFDLVALVALSENAVKFTLERQASHRVACSEIAALHQDPCASLQRALEDLGVNNDEPVFSNQFPSQ